MTRSDKLWILVMSLFVAIIIAGSAITWLMYTPDHPVEIILPPDQVISQSEIYVGGEVNNPGYYPLEVRDTVNDIIQAAGGISPQADTRRLAFYVPDVTGGEPSQKININQAEAWLLEALPGIGKTRAKAMIDYRQQYGPFRHTSDLINVEGIGTAIYEKIKPLVTVAE
ncbi:MAG: ComEA family DNA-binding protein [Dehalococcoidales bacterium]